MENHNTNSSKIGMQFGIYKIVEETGKRSSDGHALYKGVCCVCGAERIAKFHNFSDPNNRTMSCYHSRNRWRDRRLGKIFANMKRRCYDKADSDYKRYGQRGISICDEWLNNPKAFEDWAYKSGYTHGLTIDRIDVNGNYCPSNCRWVTMVNNAKYKSTTTIIDVDGELHTGRDWARKLGIGINTINKYVRMYGADNTVEFIRRFMKEPVKDRGNNISYYNAIMSTG